MPITTDEIINLCKNNLEEAKKVKEANIYSWCKINMFEFELQLYKNTTHKYVVELKNLKITITMIISTSYSKKN